MGVLWIVVAVVCLVGGVVLLWLDRRRRAAPAADRPAAWPSAAARASAVREEPAMGVTGPPAEREAGELFTEPREER